MEMTRVITGGDPRPDLVWVGNGGWVACDSLAGHSDPHRVVAYLECKDQIVYVLWVHGRAGVDEYPSLREALAAIAEGMRVRREGRAVETAPVAVAAA
ncbi:hypothetical protein MK786_14320 [Microbacterium sp. CFH 31415]|uniref:hypothetical protein n=1 Tax=Microbacterium sp. CFH 31415 TaxID=2921732 RepID=UPI001F145BDC|nr:hypothetical protein [Microbacterium sp. CFH 31415]MCH6231923.1 hypothetical protein [Microbacterium sp. CFH 31415]